LSEMAGHNGFVNGQVKKIVMETYWINTFIYLVVWTCEVEMTTQHLISDGFDIGTGRDPYKNFILVFKN
jgi:hypothetical protein